MTICALVDPAVNPNPQLREIEYLLSWERLEAEQVSPSRLVGEARRLFRSGLTTTEATQLIYQLGGVMNVAQIYKDPRDRFTVRNFTLDAALTWFDRELEPQKLDANSVGKLYAGFAHIGARLPKKAHQVLREKVREFSSMLSAKDATRIVEYYASTADHLSASVFEMAVKAIERNHDNMVRHRQMGFLHNLAILDSLYGTEHFSKGYDPRSIFERTANIYATESDLSVGGASIARDWFAGECAALNSKGLKHLNNVQHSSNLLKSLGFTVYADFNSSSGVAIQDGLDYSIARKFSDKRVGVIYDTSIKYVEGISSPRSLFPSGRTIFNSASVQRHHPDAVVVRLTGMAMSAFSGAEMKHAIDLAFDMPANVYGLNENAELQPIRKLVFKS